MFREGTGVSPMEKKAYISPAMVSVALNVTSHLMDVSGPTRSGKSAVQDNGMDTKSSGSWNVWGDED